MLIWPLIPSSTRNAIRSSIGSAYAGLIDAERVFRPIAPSAWLQSLGFDQALGPAIEAEHADLARAAEDGVEGLLKPHVGRLR